MTSVAFVKEIPYELFLQMLVTLVDEDYLADRDIQRSKDNEIFDIYLNFESMSWDRPWIADRPGIGEWVFQRRSIMFFRNGGPFTQKVNPEILNAADRKIGLKYPSYRNLADLFSNFMPGLGYAYSPNRVIQMVCVGTSSGSAKAAVLPCISRGDLFLLAVRGPREGEQIVGKRRRFVGNEEIAFAHEQIAFPHEQKRNAYEQIAFPHEQK